MAALQRRNAALQHRGVASQRFDEPLFFLDPPDIDLDLLIEEVADFDLDFVDFIDDDFFPLLPLVATCLDLLRMNGGSKYGRASDGQPSGKGRTPAGE